MIQEFPSFCFLTEANIEDRQAFQKVMALPSSVIDVEARKHECYVFALAGLDGTCAVPAILRTGRKSSKFMGPWTTRQALLADSVRM